MQIVKSLSAVTLLAAAILLVGCEQQAMYTDAQSQIAAAKAKTDKTRAMQDEQAQSVVLKNQGMYVDQTHISLKHSPSWYKRRVSIRGNNLPLDFYVAKILQRETIYDHYDGTVNRKRLVSLSYTGTVKGALDDLAAKTGLAYRLNPDAKTITWSAFETKTFNISFMPGSTKYLLGADSSSSSSSSSSSDSSGSSGATQVSATKANPDSQYSSLEGTLSVWKDLEKTVNGMLSPQGHAIVSESTTTLTVRDHPENVQEIAKYLKQMNHFMSQEVMIKVEILQVTLSKAFEYGINWNLVMGDFGIQGNLGSPVNITPIGNTTAMGAFYGTATPSSDSTGAAANTTEVLINALNQQGRVSLVTQPSVVTLNNQVATIDISQQTGYLASSTTTSDDSSGSDGDDSTSLTPGQADTGFTMYVLPKIEGRKIFLQFTAELSKLDAIESVSNVPDGANAADIDDASAIQVPDISAQDFNQRVTIPAGSTLIMSGYKAVSNVANNAGVFGVNKLGGKGSEYENVETVILITPTIVNNTQG